MKQNSKRLTSYIIAALFLVTAIVVYFEMITPEYGSLQADKGQAISEQNLYNNEKQIVGQVQSLIATYNKEASTTQAVNLALPVGQNVAGALAQVYGIAANAGFTLESTGIVVQNIQAPTGNAVSTNIGSAAATGGSIVRPSGTVTFELQGSGTYEQLQAFLSGLENNIRLFNVTGISIQPAVVSGSKSTLTTQDLFNYTLTVVTYYQSS